ncbi:MAG: hypothetical protein NBV68_00735 [Erythrobacter sp.]|uniref:hypothetical protein n=1 Tax=Erythrobacter sp. TaxID=1042 RepID=UPI0025CF980F|nr:hypothetical protein [Erythrobacter sp.]MCL9997883.1 hypothetical protein [Erythrobacter sp.]
MAKGRKGKSEQGKRKTSLPRPARMPLAAHRAFAPLLGLWGLLLGAGMVLVLPTAMVEQMLRGTLIGTWPAAQSALAWIVGGLLGGLLFAFAAYHHVGARRGVRSPSVAEMAARRVTPINPARDLGSLRLDDPVETMPFTTPAWRDAEIGDPLPAPEPAPAPEPRELDLADFAELSGRNAVWVEEAAPAAPAVSRPAPAPVDPAPADPVAAIGARTARAATAGLPVPGTAALARLRAVPASELSLAEMVERFAAALHEVRETAPGRSLGPGDLAAREAALGEALKALEALSGKGRPAPRLPRRDEPLHAARARFQSHYERARGAA